MIDPQGPWCERGEGVCVWFAWAVLRRRLRFLGSRCVQEWLNCSLGLHEQLPGLTRTHRWQQKGIPTGTFRKRARPVGDSARNGDQTQLTRSLPLAQMQLNIVSQNRSFGQELYGHHCDVRSQGMRVLAGQNSGQQASCSFRGWCYSNDLWDAVLPEVQKKHHHLDYERLHQCQYPFYVQ